MRMSAQLEIVREVPPPPAAVSSWASRAVTAGYVRGFSWEGIWQDGAYTAYGFNYASEHDRQVFRLRLNIPQWTAGALFQ